MSDEVVSATVGWCYSISDGIAALEKPEKLLLPKDKTPNKRGFLSCPAVTHALAGVVVIKSSFSLHLKFKRVEDAYLITPIYPFTSISHPKLSEFLRLEPKESWLSETIPALQFPTPYLFVADESIEVEQFSPSLVSVSNMNWRVIPGRFNIYGWQRPLNWAIEWDTKCGDLIVKQGDPLYFVRFFDGSGKGITDLNLIEIESTEEIKEKLSSTAGVTALRRGFKPILNKAVQDRKGKLLVPKKK